MGTIATWLDTPNLVVQMIWTQEVLQFGTRTQKIHARRLSEVLEVELDTRLGSGATERLQKYAAGAKMSYDEQVLWVRLELGHVLQVAQDEDTLSPHGCDMNTLQPFPSVATHHCVICGKLWSEFNGTWYDPRESTPEEIEAAQR
jgi:hypothetical protein